MCPHCKSTKAPFIYAIGEQEPYEVCVDCGKRFDKKEVDNTLPLKQF